jgi:hypothetical protein
MSAAVTFDYNAWIARFPEFTAVPQALAQQYFAEATIYWRNDGTSPNASTAIQSALLNLVTAHIAALNVQSQGDPIPGTSKDANSPVGRITSATQGTVTVQTDLGLAPSTSERQAFFAQTRYGVQFLSMTAGYRFAQPRYVPGRLQAGGLGYIPGRRWGG